MDTQIDIKLSNKENIAAYPQMLYINGKAVCTEEMEKVVGKCCYGNGHKKIITDFYDCIASGKPFAVDGRESAKVIKLILAAYQSQGENIKI